MLTPGLTILLNLCLGGLILTWLNPSQGIGRFVLIPGVILLLAAVHSMIEQRKKGPRDVVSMKAFQSGKRKENKRDGGKERPALQMVFHTFYYDEVDQLVQAMRDKGLHPMMVTQSKTGDFGEPLYQIMLPEAEARRGENLAARYRGKREHSS